MNLGLVLSMTKVDKETAGPSSPILNRQSVRTPPFLAFRVWEIFQTFFSCSFAGGDNAPD